MNKKKIVKIPMQSTDKIANSADRKISALASDVSKATQHNMSLGYNADMAYSKAIESTGYNAAAESVIVRSVASTFDLHVGDVEISKVTADNFVRKTWLNQTMIDSNITIKTAIKNGIEGSENAIKASLRESMVEARSWTATAQKIMSSEVGDPAQKMIDLGEFARRKMKGELSPSEMKEFQAEMRKMSRYVDGLQDNYSPRLKNAYKNALDKFDGVSEKALDAAISRNISAKQFYNAQRIARTEISRAYGQAQYNNFLSDDNIVGYRRTLDGDNPCELCIFLASADLYGLGEGVIPKNYTFGYPSHPHDMCGLDPVYAWEVEVGGKFDSEKANDYIDALPEDRQAKLLGVAGLSDYNDGGKWQDNLKGWNGVEKVEYVKVE